MGKGCKTLPKAGASTSHSFHPGPAVRAPSRAARSPPEITISLEFTPPQPWMCGALLGPGSFITKAARTVEVPANRGCREGQESGELTQEDDG